MRKTNPSLARKWGVGLAHTEAFPAIGTVRAPEAAVLSSCSVMPAACLNCHAILHERIQTSQVDLPALDLAPHVARFAFVDERDAPADLIAT